MALSRTVSCFTPARARSLTDWVPDPCCTVNHPQGLPKFVQAAYVTLGDNGLVHALLSPASVTTSVAGGSVTVDCETNYPFEDVLSYRITAEKPFDFYVRQPTWATGVKLSQHSSFNSETGLHKISLPAGASRFTYAINTAVRTESRANDTVAVYRGQLLYAAEIGAEV